MITVYCKKNRLDDTYDTFNLFSLTDGLDYCGLPFEESVFVNPNNILVISLHLTKDVSYSRTPRVYNITVTPLDPRTGQFEIFF